MPKIMYTLVLNCGSSSVKFQLFDMETEEGLAKGLVEKIGSSVAGLRYMPTGGSAVREQLEVLNHAAAIRLALRTLTNPGYGVMEEAGDVIAVGHRVVHGGERFVDSVLITDEVKRQIEACIQFAPLHNPHNLSGIEACEKLLPGVPQVGVFDTAFHQTMTPEAYLYALPFPLYKKLGVRRYGFHGTSHRFVAGETAQLLQEPITALKMITCHLGNGASIAALKNGQSVDTSMGFTPLEGLVMGTRCGDIDPAIVPYLIDREKLSVREINSLMNKSSGLLGLSESTNDMREIEDEAEHGSRSHQLALAVFCRRIQKYIGAYAAALGGIDVLVFTGGIGENSPTVRERSTAGLEFMGITLDAAKNAASERIISSGPVRVVVMPTDEELAIARDTNAILRRMEEQRSQKKLEEELSGLDDALKAEIVLQWAADKSQGPKELASWIENEKSVFMDVETMRHLMQTLGLLRRTDPERR
jgi:acetate kinase